MATYHRRVYLEDYYFAAKATQVTLQQQQVTQITSGRTIASPKDCIDLGRSSKDFDFDPSKQPIVVFKYGNNKVNKIPAGQTPNLQDFAKGLSVCVVQATEQHDVVPNLIVYSVDVNDLQSLLNEGSSASAMQYFLDASGSPQSTRTTLSDKSCFGRVAICYKILKQDLDLYLQSQSSLLSITQSKKPLNHFVIYPSVELEVDLVTRTTSGTDLAYLTNVNLSTLPGWQFCCIGYSLSGAGDKEDSFEEPDADLLFRILHILTVTANTTDAQYAKDLEQRAAYCNDFIVKLLPEDVRVLTRVIATYKTDILDHDTKISESVLDAMHQKVKAQLNHQKRFSQIIYDRNSTLRADCGTDFVNAIRRLYPACGISAATLVNVKSVAALVFSEKPLPVDTISDENPVVVTLSDTRLTFTEQLCSDIINEKEDLNDDQVATAIANFLAEIEPCNLAQPRCDVTFHCESSASKMNIQTNLSNATLLCLNYGTYQCAGTNKMGRRCRNRRGATPPAFCHHHKGEKQDFDRWLSSGAHYEGCKKGDIYRFWWYQLVDVEFEFTSEQMAKLALTS